MAKRIKGKALYVELQIRSGQIQLRLEREIGFNATRASQVSALTELAIGGPSIILSLIVVAMAIVNGVLALGLRRLRLAAGELRAVTATRVNDVETEDCAVAIGRTADGALVTMNVTLGAASESSQLVWHFDNVTITSSSEIAAAGEVKTMAASENVT